MGSDIALANAMGREIIAAGLVNRTFIDARDDRLRGLPAPVEPYTLEEAERITGVPEA